MYIGLHNCVDLLVICVIAFNVFCVVCTVLFYCFVYVHFLLFVISVSSTATEWKQIAVNDNNNNNQKLAEAAELIDDKSPHYKYTPANVLENEHFKLYWNRSILTDKTIPFNWPDITFTNKEIKKPFLIDIAVPNTHNLAKTITDKQNKYQELANEICAMWKQKAYHKV